MLAPRNFKRCPWHARLTNIFTRLYGIIIFVELLDDFIANAVDEGHTVKLKKIKTSLNEQKNSKIYLLL